MANQIMSAIKADTMAQAICTICALFVNHPTAIAMPSTLPNEQLFFPLAVS
jgi:hypothetical protein